MKNLILIFLFISNLAKTQNNDVYQYKFEYRLQYQSDSTNHENKVMKILAYLLLVTNPISQAIIF